MFKYRYITNTSVSFLKERIVEWKKKRMLKKHQKEMLNAFERISSIDHVDSGDITSLEESMQISYTLNVRQLISALSTGNLSEAKDTIKDIGEIASRSERVAEEYSKICSNTERKLIRREIIKYSFPSVFRNLWKNIKEFTINKTTFSFRTAILNLISYSSWKKAIELNNHAYKIPSEENIRKAGLQNMVAVFDTLTFGVIAYFAYDLVRDFQYDMFALKTAGIITLRALVHKTAISIAAKMFTLVSLDAFKSYEQKRVENQLVALKTIEVVLSALGARDEYTQGHTERVCEYSEWIAREMGYSKRELLLIRYAAKLHDLGKLHIPDAILLKKGKLEPEEFEEIKKHPIVGYAIVSQITDIDEILLGILQHHEKLDGSGYYGLKGNEIHMNARIIAVADIFDAVTTNRPYHNSKTADQAFILLKDLAAKGQIDKRVVDTFESVYSRIMK